MFFLPKAQKQFYSFLFSDTALKIARLDKTEKKLDFFYESNLPPSIISQGEVTDPQALGEFLLKIRTSLKIASDFAVVGISDHKAVTHTLLLPQLEVSEIDQAIIHEAADFLPFSYKDEYLDWMLIESLPNGDKKALVLAIPKQTVDRYREAFKIAGLSPVSFETWSLSLFRKIPKNDARLSFSLEIGTDCSVLIMVKDGSIEATSVIKDNNTILEEVEKMRDFYLREEDVKSHPINIYLSGKGAVSGMAEEIKKRLSLNPLAVAASITNIPKNRGIELALIFSLAEKKVAAPHDEKTINILPEDLSLEYSKKEELAKEKTLFRVLLVLLLATVLAVFLSFYNLQREKKILSQTLSVKEAEVVVDIKSVPPQSAALIVDVYDEGEKFKEMLSFISESVNENIRISGIKYDLEKKEIYLAGFSGTRDSLLLFREKLSGLESFKKIQLPLSSLGTTYTNDFRMTIYF